jgi:glycosyltransferase involved in cell wall biosynthesis
MTRDHQAMTARPDRNSRGRPHVCFVAPLAWPVFSGSEAIDVVGGAEVQQSILARGLTQAGYRVSMICLDYGQPDPASVDGVTVHKTYRPDSGVPVLRFIHPRITSTWQALQRVDADIYYQRSSAMLTAVVAAFCRHAGRKSIYAGASDVDFIPGRQQLRFARDRWLFEYGLRHVDAVVVQNLSQQANCLRHYGRESNLIPSCYYRPPGRGAQPGSEILWVGSIRDYKRPELFLRLAEQLPDYRFKMIGGGDSDAASRSYRDDIERRARALPNVEFLGFLPLAQVETHFDRARVFVNTSTHEGFPNTFLQAWARGVPTVAFVDTGSRQAGEPVYDVAGDEAAGLSRLRQLMTDEVAWRRASTRCRQHFEATHSPAGTLALYGRLFDALEKER